jgi:tRNA G18 (ribose-2'-O)-methylase SpoU
MIFRIDDPDDPRLEPYRAVRERDLSGRHGVFVIEGRVVLEKAVRAMPERIVSVLLAEGREVALAAIIEALAPSLPVYVAGQAVMDAIVGFPIHRGILALGRRAEAGASDLFRAYGPAALVVGLVGVANHDNMGGVFRNAAAFGADAVALDDTCCDPLYRKAIRVSVGACLTTPFARLGAAAEMVARLAAADFEVVALSPDGGETLADFEAGRRTAVLFGAEGPGLPPPILSRTRTLRIPMSGGFDSLNLATTSGIVLHHIATQLQNR